MLSYIYWGVILRRNKNCCNLSGVSQKLHVRWLAYQSSLHLPRSEFWICRTVFWCCHGTGNNCVESTSILHRTTESERGLMLGGIYNYSTIKSKHTHVWTSLFLGKVLVQTFVLGNCLWQNHNANFGRQISQICSSTKPVSVVITRFSSVWYSIFTLGGGGGWQRMWEVGL